MFTLSKSTSHHFNKMWKGHIFMQLKEISNEIQEVGGGVRSGTTRTKVFECPCGRGTITEEQDDIPGFKNRCVYIDCDACKLLYGLDSDLGTKNWDIIAKL
jgi:hypothetical protein